MPANRSPQASQPVPASPTAPAKNTAKYTNKDGSKFITVPKTAGSTTPLQPSNTTPPSQTILPQATAKASNGPVPAVNRKKQKRREKAAARAAAGQNANGAPSPTPRQDSRPESPRSDLVEPPASDEDDDPERPTEDDYQGPDGLAGESSSKSKKSRKKKKKGATGTSADPLDDPSSTSQAASSVARVPGISREKIWNISSQEERERIKEFWLGLGEDERKSLVKVEKNAVLKKMKEQQKQTCSCTVCGRKRTAIEEELEGLYDAYYEELEQFANQGEAPALLGSPRDFPSQPTRALSLSYSGQQPSRGRLIEQLGEDEEDYDDAYSEDDYEDDFSEDEPAEDDNQLSRDVADFLTFGNSLQVKGGILTVADDILQNDGRKFIEMMENLAERRLKREQSFGGHSVNGQYQIPHGSAPLEPDEYDDEEDEDDYEDSQDDGYEEQDELTEAQRMEEGRRMFQIFAARMFEQRVLTAYKEKVAKERQAKLLEELDEESRKDSQRKAKKAKDNQKKKDKAQQKKQAQAEEKARKEAEKAAEDAARQAEEEKKAEEARQRAEEKRKKREAQKKAEEEERLRKEAERQRKIHEQKEKQAEQERKAREAREAKERERKLREEQKQREKEAREQKEKEARERKERQERERLEREAKAKADKEAREKQRQAERAQKANVFVVTPIPTQPKRAPHQPISIPAALPQHPPPPNPANFASPKVPVATPAVPKLPTPVRSRQASQQDPSGSTTASQAGSGHSQNPSPHPATPTQTSPGPNGLLRGTSSSTGSMQAPFSTSPQSVSSRVPSGGPPQPFHGQPASLPHHPAVASMAPPPGFGARMPPEQPFAAMNAGFRHPGMPGPPPGITPPAGRGFPLGIQAPPPGFVSPAIEQGQIGPGFSIPGSPPISHSRQGSQTFDSGTPAISAISRPTPIGRPSATGQRVDLPPEEMGRQGLGSRALLDDSDEQLPGGMSRREAPGPGPGPSPRTVPGPSYTLPFMPMHNNLWAPSPGGHAYGAPPGLVAPGGWGPTTAFAPTQPMTHRPAATHVARRFHLVRACQATENAGKADENGYADFSYVKQQYDLFGGEISDQELLDMCETEGNQINGGGSFDLRSDPKNTGSLLIKWLPDDGAQASGQRAVGAPGEIGSSPVIGPGAFQRQQP